MDARIRIKDVFNIFGVGPVIVAEVLAGTVKTGMVIVIEGRRMEIKTMEMNHEKINEASSGIFGASLSGGDFALLSKYKGREIHVSDTRSGSDRSGGPVPNHPKGALSFLDGLFRKP